MFNKFIMENLNQIGNGTFSVKIINKKKSQDIANNYFKINSKFKIGVLIAGNAGRPGGALGKVDGTGINGSYNRKFKTQEEDVLASWLQGEEVIWKKKHSIKKFDPDLVFRDNLGVNARGGRPWGMINPNRKLGSGGARLTLQGKDFTRPFYNKITNRIEMKQSRNYNFSYTLKHKPLLNSQKTKMAIVDLVFVYGPNIAYNSKTKHGTGSRTKVQNYRFTRDYPVFRESVKVALKAGLIRMIKNKDKIAILALVSGGIYAGKGRTREKILKEYPFIINEILLERYTNKKIGSYFVEVILPIL